MNDNTQLKELVDNMCEAVGSVSEKAELPDGMDDIVRMELGMFMMYLSASDGTIKWDEAHLISDMCNLDLTPNNIGDFIRKNNIYSTEFEQKLPVIFELMVKVDNALYDAGRSDLSVSDSLLDTYKALGQAIIQSDREVDDNEVKDYKIFISMLEEYRDRNYKGAAGGATGFTKNTGSVSAPPKGGVKAPKKG